MNMDGAERAAAGPDRDTCFGERWRIGTEVKAPYLRSERTVTALIFAICGWSLIEAPFGFRDRGLHWSDARKAFVGTAKR
jgi:hypothetical protein